MARPSKLPLPCSLRWSRLSALLSLAALLLSGCATTESVVACPKESGACFWGETLDDFQLLQHSARLPEEARHEAGQELETDDAQELWEALAGSPTTLHNFGPKRCLLLLLSQVLSSEEDVPYASLLERARSFRGMVVMRPDGYLANALTGEPLQPMGRMELRDGRLMVHRFEVGGLYLNRMGVFYPVDGSLQQASIIPLGELGLEHDLLNLALDGAEDALAEMVVGLAHFFTDPVRSIQGLAQLPSAVASLIASSPEYFARYSTRPLREQIREAARLSTHLITLYGSAAGTATRVGSTGPRLPVLSLSADGALAIEQMVVPVGTRAAVLGTGASAVYILSSPRKTRETRGDALPAEGPGKWKHKKFSGSERSRRYQEQVSGRSADEVYVIDEVEYDGFTPGLLKEAKGEGYLKFFHKNGSPKFWYEASKNFRKLITQAERQSRAARSAGLQLQWHVAEREMVDILRLHFRDAEITGIDLIYTPPLP